MFSKSLCLAHEEEPIDCESSSYMTQALQIKVEIAQLKNSTLSRLLTFTNVFYDYQVTIHFHLQCPSTYIHVSEKYTAFTNGTVGYTTTAFYTVELIVPDQHIWPVMVSI